MSNKQITAVEEAAEKANGYNLYSKETKGQAFNDGFIEGAKLQAEQMYSEEDVCEFVEWLNLHYRALEHTISFKDARGTKELLQQFKNQRHE